MRKFNLHTYDLRQSFDLNNNKIFASTPAGLGNAFQTTFKDTENGSFFTHSKPKFRTITFKICFNGDGTNGYANYNSLLSFLAICGKSKFVLEYNDGINDKYCDVVFKSITKSEISNNGEFIETLELERLTFWYLRNSQEFVFKKAVGESSFPLSFPFGFDGEKVQQEVIINNNFFEPAPIELNIQGVQDNGISIAQNLSIVVADMNNTTISEFSVNFDLGDNTLVCNPLSKKILIIQPDGTTINGYDKSDKSKQSFLYVPQGQHKIIVNAILGTNGAVAMAIRQYILD